MVILKKLMNMFTGDLYSMYVVLQGIGSLPCIRVYIFHSSILKSNSTPSNDDTHVCLCMVLSPHREVLSPELLHKRSHTMS